MSSISLRWWQGVRVRVSSWPSRLACWAWAPLVGKTFGWLVLFVGLAYVGSGSVLRLLGAMPVHELAGPPKAAAALGRADAPAAPPTGRATATATSAETELGCNRADAGAAADSGAGGGAKTADGRTVLNLAEERDLDGLPGIGPKRAQAILALRTELGRFRKLEDLLRVRGIGRRLLERLRPLVVIDPPP